jgi:DNA ligase (NAD+)
MEVEGIAETSAREIFNSLHNPRKVELINALSLQGLRMEQERRNLESHALEDKLFCITGTLSQPREEIKQLIEAHGGRVMGSISSNVDYLVAGSGGGSKRAKAQKFGVEIINENQLKEMIQ